ISLPRLFPAVGGFQLTVDRLGAFFLAIIGVTGAPASLYAQGYSRDLDTLPRGRFVHALLNTFLAGMCLVAAAGSATTFLFGWEIMALASYLLVISDPAQPDAPSAGLWYAVMTHAGFLALLAAFLVIGRGSLLDFASMRAHAATLSPRGASAVFVLAALAFGSK